MKKIINLRAISILVLTLALSVGWAFAQNDKFKVPNKVVLTPVLEWQKFDGDAKGSDGKTYMNLTFGITNWAVFPDSMFAAAPDLPACGLNKEASQTWLDIYDYATDKRIYGFCGLATGEEMKSLSFNVKREQMPECIYITLTDRRTKKSFKSNPIRYTNDQPCQEKKQKVIG